ncbi:MAG: DUF2232 domain-containing protein [Treponema sp.]|jgi:hypothetical protein|nr:DUF2232 domain-containing protein [Treponema sp.]
MYLKDPAVPLPHAGKTTLVPALICAVLSVVVMRIGFLSFFFLAPLGVCAAVYGPAVWLGLVFAMLGNAVWSLGFSLRYGTGLPGIGMDMLYFTVLSAGFTWIMAGSPAASLIPPLRTLFRFIAACVAGALVLLGMIFSLNGDEGFSSLVRSQLETISSSYITSSGMDADQQAFLERMFTPDKIIEMFLMIILRGGALVSAFFLFFINRQAACILARLFRRQRENTGNDLTVFFAPRKAIWVLSLCLPVILFCRAVSLETVEIAAWNLLVICAIMFLAQGGGIVLFFLARRSMIMRLFCSLLFVCVVFSPGINVLALGVLILLGIAENWLPLRVQKKV